MSLRTTYQVVALLLCAGVVFHSFLPVMAALAVQCVAALLAGWRFFFAPPSQH